MQYLKHGGGVNPRLGVPALSKYDYFVAHFWHTQPQKAGKNKNRPEITKGSTDTVIGCIMATTPATNAIFVKTVPV